MKNCLVTTLMLISFLFFALPKLQAEEKNKALLGEWLYEVIDAPEGYEKGSFIFSEKEGKTVCVIKLAAGELPVSKLNIEKEKVSIETLVDGSPIKVDLLLENNKLTGNVDSPDGPLKLIAVKKEVKN